MRLAVFGLGRSGVSAARAALHAGDEPTVYDNAPAESPAKAAAKTELLGLGARVLDGWAESFEETLIVVSPGVPPNNPALSTALAAGKEVISEIEYAYRIARAPIVAITGTNGKSTTTVMTFLCLREASQNVILCGNIYGSGYEEVPLTEAAAAATADQVLVAEVSSYQLEWVRDFRPVVAAITNITPDHLDRYDGSFDAYAATKRRIFSAQRPSDFAVIPAHDPAIHVPHPGPHVLTFGRDGRHAKVGVDGLEILGSKISFSELPFSEPHNYQNACAAALLSVGLLRSKGVLEGDSSGLPTAIGQGLRSFRGIAHRMERLGERGGVEVINNSMCTNPDAVIKSAMSVVGRKHLLIGGINKGLDFAPLKAYLEKHPDSVYLFGWDKGPINVMLGNAWPTYKTMEEAFAAAARAAKSGETILLAPGCASMDQFEDFRDRGNVFRQIAKEWLKV